MSLVTKTKTYADDDAIVYSDLNANWDTLYNLVNGNLDNTNIASGAGIDPTKISNTAVTLTGTQTVLNKTFVKPVLNGVQNITTDTDGSTVTFDMTSSNVHVLTLGGNRTLAVSNVSVGQYFSVELLQPSSGGPFGVTWFPTISWVNGVTPTLTVTASKKDTFVFRCTGTNTYDGYIVGQAVG